MHHGRQTETRDRHREQDTGNREQGGREEEAGVVATKIGRAFRISR